jgi:cyclase
MDSMADGKRLTSNSKRTGSFVPGCLMLTATLLLAGSAFADTASTKERQVTRLGEGIFEIRHKDAPNGNAQGNTTVIVGDREVFMMGSCYLPSSAREDIAQIRSLTGKPVHYLLNTHWHNDHVPGNRAYVDAFPGITIVAQAETKKDMDLLIPGVFARAPKNLGVQFAAYESGHDAVGRLLTNDEKKEVPSLLIGIKSVQEDLQNLAYQPPTLTFDRELRFDIGNREVQVRYMGRGHTTGDAIVYLPKERILITGDLLVQPVP